jgi:predicted phage tail protein
MTDEIKIIKGAGGGGPKNPPPPYRAPDTLHSRSFATIQDLISEGEIEGFATASKAELTKGTTAYDNASLKDVFLNDTPVLNSTASNSSPAETDFNFKDVGFKSRFGTSNQTALSGIPSETRSPTGVGVVVTTSAPVTRQITNTDVNAVIVTLTWPQIQVAEDDGDLRGDTVEYKIQIQHDTGGFVDKIGGTAGTALVTGRTADAYARDHRIELTSGFTTVDIRVVRVTADSTTSNRVNAFQFTSFQEVLDNSSTYPNSAYMALRFDSKQFDRIPSRKYRIRGIKVRIPGAGASGTGTPDVDIATGRIRYPTGYVFNGVMGAATYTNCPAMCLLDLLTNTRYGLGNHIVDSNIDLFSFVAASKYANEEVDDGEGGLEARFSCNVNIQSPKEAFEAINDLAGVMRCMPIWSAGGITLSQDKETSASYLFNLANVGQGGFSYSGSSLKTRSSVISVAYFNMDSKEVDLKLLKMQLQ